jgi:hypothetical protein
MTIAGRIFRLLKSVNGIGSRMMSSREQFIENVVGVVFPQIAQTTFGLSQPGRAIGVVRVQSFDGETDAGVFRERERFQRAQHSAFVDGFQGGCHTRMLSLMLNRARTVAAMLVVGAALLLARSASAAEPDANTRESS